MIWHIVRFDLSALEEATRVGFEQMLAGLEELDPVAWVQVARDLDTPEVTGLVTLFTDREALETYRTHPQHLPVIERIRELGIPATRLDLDVPLPPAEVG